MIDVNRKIFWIVMPITLCGTLLVVTIMHFFVMYIFNSAISTMPEHKGIFDSLFYYTDILVVILTITATSLFLWFTLVQFKKFTDQDVNKYLLAIESASNHIVITDSNGIIFYANKSAEAITGYTLEEMKGNTPRLWGGLMPKDFYKNLWRTIKYDRKPFCGEVKNRRKNQEEYYASIRIDPIISENDNITGFVATEEDITHQKQLDKDLESARIAQQDSLKNLQIEKEKLADRIKELETLNRITVGRELKMTELKKEISELKKEKTIS